MQPTNTRGTDTGNAARSDEGFLSGAATTVKEKAQDAASSVASAAEGAWDSTRRAASAVADTTENAWSDLTGLMRRYPFGTLFVGIGLGFLLSRVLGDRPDRALRDVRRMGSEMYDRVSDFASDVAAKFQS